MGEEEGSKGLPVQMPADRPPCLRAAGASDSSLHHPFQPSPPPIAICEVHTQTHTQNCGTSKEAEGHLATLAASLRPLCRVTADMLKKD